jgi:hypothetical protein
MKKLFLSAVLVCTALFTANAQSGTVGNLTWNIANNTLTISGNGAIPGVSIAGAPWRVYNDYFSALVIEYGVTSIGNNAFRDNPNLTSATIGNTVTTIGDAVFQGTGITSIIIPNSVITIGLSAFMSTPLTSVTIGNSVTTIRMAAFSNTNLQTVRSYQAVPPNVTVFPGSAFAGVDFTQVCLYLAMSPEVEEAYRLAAGWSSFTCFDVIPGLFVVTFNSQGGSAVPPQTVMAGDIIPRPTDPTRAGYFFAGW